MSITRSVEFYAGRKNVRTKTFFGGYFMNYEFSKDIAYKEDITFVQVSEELRNFMIENNIKIGYCDISVDFGGGYSLCKRYTFINKNGKFVTKKQNYGW